MKHILPPRPKKRIYEPPKRKKVLSLRKRRHGPARSSLFQDHYAQPQKRRVPKRWRYVFISIAAILIIQGIFHVPFFRVTDILITGIQYIDSSEVQSFVEQQLQRRRWIIFKNNNYFLLSVDSLASELEDRYFVTVNLIDKQFPNKIKIDVSERVAGFVLQTPEQYIQIDSQGSWVGEVAGPESNQGVIADERAEYGVAIPINYLEKATIIEEGWKAQISEIELVKFHLNDEPNTITVSTNKNFRVFFSSEKDIDQQLRRLATFIEETDLEEPREYIDLRFDESLYIR